MPFHGRYFTSRHMRHQRVSSLRRAVPIQSGACLIQRARSSAFRRIAFRGRGRLHSDASHHAGRLLTWSGRVHAGRSSHKAREALTCVHDGLSTRSACERDNSRAGRVWRSRRGQAAVASHLTQLYHGLEVRQNGQGPIDDRPRRLLARTRPNRQGLTAVLDGRALRPQQRRPHAAQGLQGQR